MQSCTIFFPLSDITYVSLWIERNYACFALKLKTANLKLRMPLVFLICATTGCNKYFPICCSENEHNSPPEKMFFSITKTYANIQLSYALD